MMFKDIVNYSYHIEIFESKQEHNKRMLELIIEDTVCDVIHNGTISDINTKLFGIYKLSKSLRSKHTKNSSEYKQELIKKYKPDTLCIMYKKN